MKHGTLIGHLGRPQFASIICRTDPGSLVQLPAGATASALRRSITMSRQKTASVGVVSRRGGLRVRTGLTIGTRIVNEGDDRTNDTFHSNLASPPVHGVTKSAGDAASGSSPIDGCDEIRGLTPLPDSAPQPSLDPGLEVERPDTESASGNALRTGSGKAIHGWRRLVYRLAARDWLLSYLRGRGRGS
jgi:hypothetical protein